MNYITVAQDTIKITRNKTYQIGTDEVKLPDLDYEKVLAYSPEAGTAYSYYASHCQGKRI